MLVSKPAVPGCGTLSRHSSCPSHPGMTCSAWNEARVLSLPGEGCSSGTVGICQHPAKTYHSQARCCWHLLTPRQNVSLTGAIVLAFVNTPAVALLGLHVSTQHLTSRAASALVLLLDGDRAGRRASFHLHTLLPAHIPTQLANLPDDADPDDLSDSALLKLLRKVVP